MDREPGPRAILKVVAYPAGALVVLVGLWSCALAALVLVVFVPGDLGIVREWHGDGVASPDGQYIARIQTSRVRWTGHFIDNAVVVMPRGPDGDEEGIAVFAYEGPQEGIDIWWTDARRLVVHFVDCTGQDAAQYPGPRLFIRDVWVDYEWSCPEEQGTLR